MVLLHAPVMRMFSRTCLAALAVVPNLYASEATEAPWARHTYDIETGITWQVGSNTPINYRLVTSQLTWRSPYHIKFDFENDSKIVFRSQVSLIGTWVETGPESYYFGFSSAPSLEWWSPADKWSVFLSVGGGFGLTDSTDVPGGQGQDFTLNWFAKTGLRYQLSNDFGIHAGAFFQHLSNGGATRPNPGIDALGATIGASFSF